MTTTDFNNPFSFSAQPLRAYLAQPQLTRTRHRYRGQKESYKFNLEIGQMRFDIIKLIEKYINLRANLDLEFNIMYDGFTFPNVLFHDLEQATPSDAPLISEGINNLASKMTKLDARLKVLEDI